MLILILLNVKIGISYDHTGHLSCCDLPCERSIITKNKRSITMDNFIDEILAQSGAKASADPEVEAQLKADLTERAAALINRRLVDALTDEQTDKLNQLLDDQPDNVEAFQQFIIDNLPDKDQIVAAALYEFRVLYLGSEA